ncbi:unnamed protein product [Hydatigera taeniaeformis]|uniref:NADH dehydrogenase subunit 2 n=1 Tax=Hydatigena taeniaeformis TaxID=6205 RepID=A0A0R3X402_HYDTA|nr:unnamed protein product [Hydatigera taeniaeformis]
MFFVSWFLIVTYFYGNMGNLMNVVDPMWRILSSHAGIITSLLTGTTSLLFAGGSAVLNFSFSFVLLSFYTSVEVAVTSVVVTTLKRTIFYGMYTLLTHTLFGLDVIVLPSIIATILGAIPLVGTYWVVLPGAVELWCLRGSYWLALLLLLLHLLPYSFLDTAFYSEIKGAGHPYLTGLSIAGGLYCFGTEGVFIGPVVLCCMLVGVNLFRLLLTEETGIMRMHNYPSSNFSLI